MKQIEVENDMKNFHDMLNKEAKQRGLPFTEYKHIAVGYLDITEDYSKGSVSQDFINKLKQICNRGLSLMSCGHHTCEFCKDNATSSSEKILRDEENKVEYKFPEMIFHYIEKHNYQPPKDFILFIEKYMKKIK